MFLSSRLLQIVEYTRTEFTFPKELNAIRNGSILRRKVDHILLILICQRWSLGLSLWSMFTVRVAKVADVYNLTQTVNGGSLPTQCRSSTSALLGPMLPTKVMKACLAPIEDVTNNSNANTPHNVQS
jgi:hypothetical protein